MTENTYLEEMDKRMSRWYERLQNNLNLPEQVSMNLASTIYSEAKNLPYKIKKKISNDLYIIPEQRLYLYDSYSIWEKSVDMVHRQLKEFPSPVAERKEFTQQAWYKVGWLAMLYISIVYPGDVLYELIAKEIDIQDTTLYKCVTLLRDRRIRAIREALAHGKWWFEGFNFILFNKSEKLEVDYNELDFWIWLSRCTFYGLMQSLMQ
ncbi:MAG: hypothetical protein ABIH42_00885 [Planctomycetota bacterium]